MAKLPKPEELLAARPAFPKESWFYTTPIIKAGNFAYPANLVIIQGLHITNSHELYAEK